MLTVMRVWVTLPGKPWRGSRGTSWGVRVFIMKSGGKRWVSVVISGPAGDVRAVVHLINIDLLSFLQEASPMESWRCYSLNICKERYLSSINMNSEGCREVLCTSSFKERISSVALLWGVLTTPSGIFFSAAENCLALNHGFLEKLSTNDWDRV